MGVEINLKLDFRNKVPLSDQVQDKMRRLIQGGSLHPGDQLPTVRELATQLKVNFNTIARAYRALDHEGLISTQQGRGTYVIETESARYVPERTKEEWAEQLVDDLFKNANSQEVPLDLVSSAFQNRLPKKARNRPLRAGPKKRVYIPTGDRAWVRLKHSPGLKKPQKKRQTDRL